MLARSLVLCLFLVCSQAVFNPDNYSNSSQLNPYYTIYWEVDFVAQKIQIALQVETLGWIGFGLSEPTSGSMPGSDVVVATFPTPAGQVNDYHTVDYIAPILDNCQNWVLVSSQLVDGVRTVEISRVFDTGDDQDRPFHAGLTRIIFAYGTNTTNTLQYHGANRHMFALTFWPSPSDADFAVPDQNVSTVAFSMGNFAVPSVTTTYACIAYMLPLPPGSPDQHVIQIDPVITSNFAHHLLVHICDNITGGYVQSYFENAGACNSAIGNPYAGCPSVLFAWGLGTGTLVLPLEAGFRAGYSSTAFLYIVIEMHLNNPSNIAGGVDDSGIVIHYTPNLRKYDAASMIIGDPVVTLPSIPPNIALNEFDTECPSACTSQFSQPISVFSSFLHMHLLGKQMWTSQYRGNSYIGTLNRADFYDFNAQQLTRLNVTIQPGDSLHTHCVYDSTSRSTVTTFGIQSTNEMCMHLISYYPSLSFQGNPFSYCGYIRDPSFPIPNATICGSDAGLETASSIIFSSNPTSTDFATSAAIVFGTPNCGSGSGTGSGQISGPTSGPTGSGQISGSSTLNHSFLFFLSFALLIFVI